MKKRKDKDVASVGSAASVESLPKAVDEQEKKDTPVTRKCKLVEINTVEVGFYELARDQQKKFIKGRSL